MKTAGEDQSGPRPLRSDTKRNLQRLLLALEEIAAESPEKITMQNLAERAEIGLATAYRYFPSVDSLIVAHSSSVLEELSSYSTKAEAEGRELFEEVVRQWIKIVEDHGKVMVQLRSRRGFLERLRSHEEIITVTAQIWQRPITGLLESLQHPRPDAETALFFCNMIFDPREVTDLREHFGLSRERVATQLTDALIGSLQGWALREYPAQESNPSGR